MKKFVFAAVAATTLGAATLGLSAPASAQFFVGADQYGAGVQVGPVGAGVGPRFWGGNPYERGYGAYAYGEHCRVVRERIRHHGRVIVRTHRICR
jgi:hypothetical protein